MLQVSKFDVEYAESLQVQLKRLENRSEGVKASPMFMPDGCFTLFSWPDWPENYAGELGARVEGFCREHPELVPVDPGSRVWASVLRGRVADYESAAAIADAFNRHFEDRVKWVESEKDTRGRIGASCFVEAASVFYFDLRWKDSLILPLDALDGDNFEKFRRAGHEVMAWAEGRIRPILASLDIKLRALYGDRFRGLYVFGSYARPDAGIRLPDDSDLDVAVLLTDMESSYNEIQATSDITADLSLEHGLVISLVHLREADFREGKTNFARVIAEYAIPVE